VHAVLNGTLEQSCKAEQLLDGIKSVLEVRHWVNTMTSWKREASVPPATSTCLMTGRTSSQKNFSDDKYDVCFMF